MLITEVVFSIHTLIALIASGLCDDSVRGSSLRLVAVLDIIVDQELKEDAVKKRWREVL